MKGKKTATDRIRLLYAGPSIVAIGYSDYFSHDRDTNSTTPIRRESDVLELQRPGPSKIATVLLPVDDLK
ncbi:hypothetical protein Csa_005209 [Cucumis sativus]|uniref:Uncharacterized protein n=1 Tax=Cucumis sativus TaxID=3659 RepID=A0A0A0K8I9_CUCSA|nr:hypothetical protein Csa_005209 [Cucumis sativus]